MTDPTDPVWEERGPWIGVDFDGTLATYENWLAQGRTGGEPIPAMVERIKRWWADGYEVRIMTARVASVAPDRDQNRAIIEAWCERHLGAKVPVTAEKDYAMVALWDDRAIGVRPNTGMHAHVLTPGSDPLTPLEELDLSEVGS